MWSIGQIVNYLMQSTALWCKEYYQAIYIIYIYQYFKGITLTFKKHWFIISDFFVDHISTKFNAKYLNKTNKSPRAHKCLYL